MEKKREEEREEFNAVERMTLRVKGKGKAKEAEKIGTGHLTIRVNPRKEKTAEEDNRDCYYCSKMEWECERPR
jgi:PP-loop superfamily ATP-utilizing enzyme